MDPPKTNLKHRSPQKVNIWMSRDRGEHGNTIAVLLWEMGNTEMPPQTNHTGTHVPQMQPYNSRFLQ